MLTQPTYFVGYWLATAAPKILISKSSTVGSIGVISESLGFHKLIQNLGIEGRVQTAGKSKAYGHPYLPQKVSTKTLDIFVYQTNFFYVQEEDLEMIQGELSEMHKNFKNQVISSRGDRIDPKDEDLFSGKVWIGQQAVDNGLVDGLSSIPRYIEVKLMNLQIYIQT